MKAWMYAFALLSAGAQCAGLADLPAPGSPQESLELSAYLCARDARELLCRRAESGAPLLYGVPPIASVLALRDDSLMRVSITFDEVRFDDIRRAMRAELGPGEEGSELLTAGMGGSFANRFEFWRQDGRILLLEQYFERVVRSGLSVMSVNEFERLQLLRQSQRVHGARDL